MKTLIDLAAIFRFLQLLAHNFHHVCGRAVFFQDHAQFSTLYKTYEEAYDGCIERIIGLGGTPDLAAVAQSAVAILTEAWQQPFSDNGAMFARILDGERAICATVEELVKAPGATQGTINFLAGLSDESEQRQYLLNQRLKSAAP